MTQKPNILVITSETAVTRSRFLDALGSGSVSAGAFFPSGSPGYANWGALLTGMHPVHLGMASRGNGAELPLDAAVIAESFLSAGYTTCTFDNLRRGWHWFGTGFEYYIDPGVRHGGSPSPAEINARAIPWLRSHRDEPLFVCVRYGANSDVAAAQLVSALDEMKLARNTLVAVVSATGLEQGELHLRWPDGIPAGARFDGRIQTHDLAPTLLEAAGLNVPANMDGVSFWKAWLAGSTWREPERVYGLDCGPPQRWRIGVGDANLTLTLDPEANILQRDATGLEPEAAVSMAAELQRWRTERLQEWERMAEFLEV